MIIADHTFKNKQAILKTVGKKFQKLIEERKITADQAKELQKDIEETLVRAFSPIKFTENLTLFCEKYPEFQEVLEKIKNINSEYLQETGKTALDILMDEDPEKWQKAVGDLTEVDETNFNDWSAKLPQNAKVNFTKKLLTT